MDLRALLSYKAFQAHIAQEGPRNHQGIGENHGHPVRDAAAQDNQKQRRRLKTKINHPKVRARKPFTALMPQQQDDQHADDIDDHIAEDDCSQVK